MNETPDPLEAELSALSPHEVSPEFRRRIAERLAEPSNANRAAIVAFRSAKERTFAERKATIRRPVLAQSLKFAVAVAAACLIAVTFWFGRGAVDSQPVVVGPRSVPHVEPVSHVEPVPRVVPVAPAINADWQPRLLTYQRALARSPEELDVVFNREAPFATESQAQLLQFRAFTPSNASLNALLGDN